MNKNINHFKLCISGRVQGVGFRYSAQNQARLLGIAGFVKNHFDGSVTLEIEGNEESISRMIEWCRKGPPLSRVDDVIISEGDSVGFTTFSIR